MKKNITLSLVAGAFLASTAFLVGCGSSSSTPAAAVTVTAPVVNSYLVYLPSPATDDANQSSLVDSNNTSGKAVIYTTDTNKTTGKIQFPSAITGNIRVPADAVIDSNGNGIYDINGTDKAIGFVMKGKKNQPITPLSTYEIENNTTLPASLQNVDPIAAMKAGNPTAYLIEQAIIKAMKVNASKTAKSVLSDLNITATGITSISKDANTTNALKIADRVNIEAVRISLSDTNTSIEKIINSTEVDGNLTSTIQAVVSASNLTAAVVASYQREYSDKNFTDSDYNTTKASLITAETNTTDTISAQPAKLLIGSISVGGIQATPDDNGNFEATVNTTDKNITDFYNVKLNTSATKAFTDVTGVNLTITITDKTVANNNVSLKIEGVTLGSDAQGNVKTTIPVSSPITVTQNNLGALESIMTTGTPYVATTTKKLTTTDLSFSISTLLANLSNSNVQNALTALNTYLSQAREYTVTLELSGLGSKLVSDLTTFTGSVKVENTATATTASSSSSEPASSSSSTPASSSSSAATDPFGNPISSASSSSSAPASSSSSAAASSSSSTATDPFGNPIS